MNFFPQNSDFLQTEDGLFSPKLDSAEANQGEDLVPQEFFSNFKGNSNQDDLVVGNPSGSNLEKEFNEPGQNFEKTD